VAGAPFTARIHGGIGYCWARVCVKCHGLHVVPTDVVELIPCVTVLCSDGLRTTTSRHI